MKQLTLFLILLISNFSFSQTTFQIDNFSKDYYGKLFIADTTQVFSKGWVAIYDTKTNKQLIKIDSKELYYELHDGKVLANINQIPYGEQSQIIYQDFNFDGKEDLALMDGQNSCYHLPSFQIYLATNNGFKQSPEFTELAQNYCGMFNADSESKIISTMTKSGCCWHQFSEFKIKDNKPYAISIVEEGLSADGVTWDYVDKKLVNDKLQESTFQMLAIEIDPKDLILFFEFENKKRLSVFIYNEHLYYGFFDAKERIELLYVNKFLYSPEDNTLTFNNIDTQYLIYNDKVIAKTPTKTYDMKAVKTSILGDLNKLKNLKLENLKN